MISSLHLTDKKNTRTRSEKNILKTIFSQKFSHLPIKVIPLYKVEPESIAIEHLVNVQMHQIFNICNKIDFFVILLIFLL